MIAAPNFGKVAVIAIPMLLLAVLGGYRLSRYDGTERARVLPVVEKVQAGALPAGRLSQAQMAGLTGSTSVPAADMANHHMAASTEVREPNATVQKAKAATTRMEATSPSETMPHGPRNYKIPAIFSSADALQNKFAAPLSRGAVFSTTGTAASVAPVSFTNAAQAFNDSVRSQGESAAVAQLQEKFVSEVRNSGHHPDSPEYLEVWERVRGAVDGQYRILFGWDAYNRRERDAYIKAAQLSIQGTP